MLVRRISVDNGVDGLVCRNIALDAVEKLDETLFAAPHVLPDDGSIQNVQRRKQGGFAVALVIMGQWLPRAPSLLAGRAACDQAPEFATFHRPKARPRGRAARHTGRQYQ